MLLVVPFEKTSFVKAVFWKALSPNSLIVEFDKFNEVKLVHPSKTLLPIVTLLAFPKLNDLRLEFLKALFPIETNELGAVKLNEFALLTKAFSNALSPIVVTELGNSKGFKFEHPLKVEFPILIKFEPLKETFLSVTWFSNAPVTTVF